MPRRPQGPPRGPRITKFALVFWTDCPLPCSDVVHTKSFVRQTANVGDELLVMYGKTPKLARVLKFGSQRKLKELHVQAAGTITPNPLEGVSGRRDCELRQRIETRRANVDRVEDAVIINELDNEEEQAEILRLDKQPIPVQCPRDIRELLESLPRFPSVEEVRLLMLRLPCLNVPPADQTYMRQLVDGLDCYINCNILARIHRKYQDRPGLYLLNLLSEVVPDEVLVLPHVTAAGQGGTAGLPKVIFKSLVSYIEHFSKGFEPKNGWSNCINNHIHYLRSKRLMGVHIRNQPPAVLPADAAQPSRRGSMPFPPRALAAGTASTSTATSTTPSTPTVVPLMPRLPPSATRPTTTSVTVESNNYMLPVTRGAAPIAGCSWWPNPYVVTPSAQPTTFSMAQHSPADLIMEASSTLLNLC